MHRVIAVWLSFAAASPLAAQDTAALREELEDVVAFARLKDFACMVAAEAYALQSKALDGQPKKRAIVEQYRALVALEQGDVLDTEFASTARQLNPTGEVVNPVILELVKSGRASFPLRMGEPKWRPGHTIALEDLPDRSRDVIYELYDPAEYRWELLRRASVLRDKLPAVGENFEADLIRRWCAHFLSDRLESIRRLDRAAIDALKSEDQAEDAALNVINLATEAQAAIEEDKLLARPSLGVWAIRAASLVNTHPTRLLEAAQRTVRERTKDLAEGPFDPKLVRFRTKEDQARLAELLDLYWEVAWCYRAEYLEVCGHRIPQNPPLAAVRGGTLAVHLSNPTLRVDWDLMRIVQSAELRAYQRDLQSWQLELTDERIAETPALGVARYLARAVAGSIDLPEEVQILQPGDEAFSEEVEPLLVGGAEAAAIETPAAATIPIDNSAPPVAGASRFTFGFFALALLVGGGLLVVVIAAVLMFASRETEERSS